MKWTISGADRDSGEDVTLIIEADDRTSAESKAGRKGVLVSVVEPVHVASYPTVRTVRRSSSSSSTLLRGASLIFCILSVGAVIGSFYWVIQALRMSGTNDVFQVAISRMYWTYFIACFFSSWACLVFGLLGYVVADISERNASRN